MIPPILQLGFEQPLLRAFGRLAADRLDGEARTLSNSVDHQDLLDIKSVVKSKCMERVDTDLEGIGVRSSVHGGHRNLRGAIEGRIDESLQLKQEEILG